MSTGIRSSLWLKQLAGEAKSRDRDLTFREPNRVPHSPGIVGAFHLIGQVKPAIPHGE